MNFARPLTIAATAVLAVSISVSTANSQGLSAGAENSLRQRPMVMAAEQVLASVQRSGHPGYAGITLADKEVMLWWKGDVPADVTATVRQATRQAPVRVAKAVYSQAELTAAAEKLEAWRKANPGAGIHGVKNPGDGSGLVLAAYPGVATVAALPTAGVTVKVVHEQPMVSTSRKDDAPPWKGGAGTWNQTAGTICTSGFGVRNSANARFVLSAEHCGQSGHRIADRAGQFIGNVGAAHDDHDISLIPTSSTTNQMYVGNGDSNTVTTVTGWGHVFVGQFLCQSGVTSAEQTGGPVCNLKVIFFYQDAEDLVEAEQTDGQPAARGGDSGGSVYSYTSGGVVANGTVTRTAGARLGFQDFATANRDFGIYIP
ncbi:hypothetical protein JOF56_007146 [Kibdelosporangium banguiense]|uniref:Streptogrisin C n=1 Tax=Kibdelosporangium banguiense TaxID=1365924 RepID=A0ABS4TQS0_9PSEU|nr:hypothetical protein [Kibdelosporangium banguiense]MBP2326761.1 hypothetical protein [Kibdelosporangium banguiense]